MKKILATLSAAVFCFSTLLVAGAPADAARLRMHHGGYHGGRHGFYHHGGWGYYNGHRGYRHYRHGYHYYNGWWFPAAVLGGIGGAIIGNAMAPQPVYRGGNAHVRWCYSRYKSYRASDNTYQPYNGPRRECVGP